MNEFKKSLLVTALMVAGMTAVHAAPIVPTTQNKFVMFDADGFLMGENTNITFTWDGTYNTVVNTAVSNATLAPFPGDTFYGGAWTAHDIKVYSGGRSYDFFSYPTIAVAANQVALTMLFDWGVNGNIEVVEICERGAIVSSDPGVYSDATVWDCASVDGNGDGVPGILMNNGPFSGTANANFNLMGLVEDGGAASGNTVAATVKPTRITKGGSSGGCAMDPAGHDVSLLIAVLGGLGYASWRRRRS